MTTPKNPAAVTASAAVTAAAAALGRLGGKVTSPAKAAAARRNAKLGGWPKGKKRGTKK